ncbi:FAD-dependent monooxygenase [Mesorhizobium atlanticum]
MALVGDAAHAMCPALAQGAGCAMVNAFSLSQDLEESASVEDALVAWEDAYSPDYRSLPGPVGRLCGEPLAFQGKHVHAGRARGRALRPAAPCLLVAAIGLWQTRSTD